MGCERGGGRGAHGAGRAGGRGTGRGGAGLLHELLGWHWVDKAGQGVQGQDKRGMKRGGAGQAGRGKVGMRVERAGGGGQPGKWVMARGARFPRKR